LLCDVTTDETTRYATGFSELDRVLGGEGLVQGGYVLLGGDPGIGKSTLMLQLADNLVQTGHTVLYASGEESAQQIWLRSQRLQLALHVQPASDDRSVASTSSSSSFSVSTDTDAADDDEVAPGRCWISGQTQLEPLVDILLQLAPTVAIIDSIQTLYAPEAGGVPGSQAQIRACATALMSVAKTSGITIVLVGHVTKEGALSGPKLLEHTVDTVLMFEGDKHADLRILRATKNRFGSTQEIGVFEMTACGLRDVENPSALFLADRGETAPGSVVLATLEGSRPLLVEVQALVGQTAYSNPRRVANGFSFNRLHQIVAILERRLGLDLSRQDVYVNVAGGLRVDEPAADIGVALAIISSIRDVPVMPHTAVAGELGLTGEVRAIQRAGLRAQEARRLGIQRVLLPKINPPLDGTPQPAPTTNGTEYWTPVATLVEALHAAFHPEAGERI
jgi:DNA repair protein RadA/Sms